jgi:hypothetical protein
MSGESQEWFITERTRALAMVHLTRRDDLVIRNAPPGVGLDLLVGLTRKKGEQSVRQFGVFLRGTTDPVTAADLDKRLRPAMKSFLRIGPFPYPVCLFHFTMDGDQGRYTWVAEPAVTDDAARLVMHEAAHCRELDRAALDEIVVKVDRWYDAFFRQVTVKAS